MIYAQALHASLLAISFLPLLNAQYLRADPPLPTPPPLFIRQVDTCGSTATLCNDGSGGCCGIGAACTYSRGLPACDEACAVGAPQCTGVMDGFCCKIGYTCNYVSTICVKNNPGLIVPTFTPIVIHTIVTPTPIVVATPIVVLTSDPTFPRPTTSSKLPTSITSSEEQTSFEEVTSEVTSSTEVGSTAALSSELEETTSTPTIASTSTAAAPTQSIINNGQHKLGLDLKVLLAGYGLAFLWGY